MEKFVGGKPALVIARNVSCNFDKQNENIHLNFNLYFIYTM